MLGDASDLVAILAWCAAFWESEPEDGGDDEDPPALNYAHPADLRRSVGELMLDLVESFENVEKEVRKGYDLASAKKTKTSVQRHHEEFLARRRQLALAAWPYPRNPDAANVAAWKTGQLLRLLPGDAGAVAWRLSKESFLTALLNEVVLTTGADGPDAAEVAEIMDSFPVDV
ncbi:hypothetical protein F4860DRAFT_255897 [Xylaria cubensis]|nr:hypothetical protein F4860DRAFT_255897 [Xylaria cubensis]